MNKSFTFVAVILLASIVVVSGCVGQSSTTVNNTNSPPSEETPQTNTTIQAKTVTVDIKNFAFSPVTITINKGDSIIWTNQDAAPHTVTSDSGSELASSTLNKGDSYTHTFNTAGSFSYFCTFHPGMKAIVVVQ